MGEGFKEQTAWGTGLQEKWRWEVNASGRKGGRRKGKILRMRERLVVEAGRGWQEAER